MKQQSQRISLAFFLQSNLRSRLRRSRRYLEGNLGSRRPDLHREIGIGSSLSFHGATISYDADGNVTQKYKSGAFNRQLFWSAESRLDSAMLDSYSMVKYEYNALGKPVVKSRKISGGSWAVDSYFIWDGDQLLLELDASGNRRADYVYYPGTIDQPAAQTIGATGVTAIRDIRMDALGNVTGTVDGTAKSQTVDYDGWGKPSIAGNSDNRLLWKRLMWEGDDVSLYFVRNRWYDPELGRFANEDPIGHAGGENLYTFGNNDPTNASDPAGLLQESCTTQWVEFGTNGGTETHAYSFLVCRTVGGGGGPPTLGGIGSPSDPGTGGSGIGSVGPAASHPTMAAIPKWKTPACFVSAGLLGVSALTDAAYVAGVGLAVRAGSSLLTAVAGVALQDALEVKTGIGLNRSIMIASGAQARNLGFGLTGAAFESREYSIRDFLIDMVPFVRTKARFSEARAACQ